jgi:molybdate transport system substrate-binding protein
MNISIRIIDRLRNSPFLAGWGFRYPIVFVTFSVFSCNSRTDDKLTIAASANVQFAMDTLATLFEAETGIKTNIITGSSGKLTAQILQGAPYDIFLSADMKYPELIYTNGKAFGAPVVYAYGSLILWTQKDDILPDPATLPSKQIRRIAIANPRTAPYGIASVEFLKNSSLFDKVKDKLIFGESISQVNQFITSKSADIGFSAESVVLASELSEKGKWTKLDPAKHAPLEQGLIIVNRKNVKKEEAEKFFEFILSYQAKKVISEFGYKTHLSNE